MADKRITELTEQTVPHATDVIPIVDNSGTPTTKKIKFVNLTQRIVSIKTGNYSITTSDQVIVCNSGVALTITLPVSTGSGQTFEIVNVGVGLATVNTTGADTINGDASEAVDQWAAMQVVDYTAGAYAII